MVMIRLKMTREMIIMLNNLIQWDKDDHFRNPSWVVELIAGIKVKTNGSKREMFMALRLQ